MRTQKDWLLNWAVKKLLPFFYMLGPPNTIDEIHILNPKLKYLKNIEKNAVIRAGITEAIS